MKRLVSLLLVVAIFATMFVFPLNVYAEEVQNRVTRAEWITSLVDTFSMVVEEDAVMPDNYFGDITSDMECYDDILLAVEFGVIDLAAGEDFKPDEPATREFAAQTLNYCLKFQLDDNYEYTYSEADSVTYPDDIQVAVNRGWFSLSNGDFLPDNNITKDETSAMLEDAKNVYNTPTINSDYDSSFEFADGVIVIPNGTDVKTEKDDNNYSVIIADYNCNIRENDVFVVFSYGIPVALVAESISVVDNITTITATSEGTENAIISADSEGVVEVDLSNFVADDIETYQITNTDNDKVELMSVELYDISYDTKSNVLTASENIKLSGVCAGSITVEVSNIKLEHRESTGSGVYEAYLTGNTKVTKTISFDFGNYVGIPNSIPIGYIPLEGIGNIKLEVEADIKGGMTEVQEGTVMVGYCYTRGNGFRLASNYKKTSYSFSAEAEISVGLKLSLNIDLIVVEGSLWAMVGARGTYYFVDYTYVDGNRPLQCETIKAYMFAEVGGYVAIKYIVDQSIWRDSYPIYDEDNSPARVYYHYEDGELVDCCTRDKTDNPAYTKYTTKTGSKYFNPSPKYSKGSYSNADGTTTTLWTYTLDSSNNATITGYKGSASALAIPSKVDGYTVTAIGNNAFYGNANLRSVTIADTIIEIKNNAFYNCTNLQNVKLSKCLTKIAADTFYNTNIKSITIPKTLETAYNNYGPFRNAKSLTEIIIEEGMIKIPDTLFANIPNVKEITIPDTVTVIGSRAFSGCKNLITVNIPVSVTEIQNEAFYNCTNLENVNLPKYLTKIAADTFYNTNIKSITIPKTLETAYNNYGPFRNAENLTEIIIEEGMTKIPGTLFSNIPNVKEITIPDTVTVIGSRAFSGCKNLTTVNIPDSVIEIQNEAFINCSSLENINIPKYLTTLWQDVFTGTKIKSVTIPKTLEKVVNYSGPFNNAEYLTDITIEDGTTKVQAFLFSNIPNVVEIAVPDTVSVIGTCAFSSCKNLRTVELPDSVIEIQNEAFINCSNLESVNIPKYLTTLSSKLFASCAALKEFNIPDNIIAMESNVFSDCKELKEVKLSNSCNAIPSNTFYNCIALENIIFPESLEKISDSAFYGCKSLEKLDFPKLLAKIGKQAFYDCTSLNVIILHENVSSIGISAFQNCDALTKAVIKGYGTIGESAFYDCDALESITISDKVTSIGKNICYGCDSLTEVKLGNGITTIPDSAFRLCGNLETVTIPRFCTTIAANAFAEDTELKDVYIPVSVTSINNNSFSYPEKMTIHGKVGSYAEEYANSRSIDFVAIDTPITTLAYPESSMNIARSTTVLPDMQIVPEFDTDVVTFASSDTNIATVSAHGAIYGKNYGTATIFMSTPAGLSDSIEVTVVRPATSVVLNKAGLDLAAGNSEILEATMNPTNSTDIIKWSSDDTSVAVVDDNGKVTAIAKGTATITATAEFGNKSATCLVTVVDSDVPVVDVTGVELNSANQEIVIGKTFTLVADVLPADATNKLVEWSTSNTSVADVADGVVTAKSLGTATITVKTVSGGYTATCKVTVVPKLEIIGFTAANYGPYAFINLVSVNAPTSAKLYVVSYDAYGKMLEVQSPVLSNGNASAIFQTANVDEFRAYIWNSQLKPLAEIKKCKIQ